MLIDHMNEITKETYKVAKIAQTNNLHCVSVLFENNTAKKLEHREGWFTTLAEANAYGDYIYNQEKLTHEEIVIYVDDELMSKHII